MGGASHPGEFIEMKVVAKLGKHIIVEIDDDEQREYLKQGTTYVGDITPKPAE